MGVRVVLLMVRNGGEVAYLVQFTAFTCRSSSSVMFATQAPKHRECPPQQVVEAGGIPRLVSLFANSGGGGTAVTARKNAAICLAKVARDPNHKEVGVSSNV